MIESRYEAECNAMQAEHTRHMAQLQKLIDRAADSDSQSNSFSTVLSQLHTAREYKISEDQQQIATDFEVCFLRAVVVDAAWCLVWVVYCILYIVYCVCADCLCDVINCSFVCIDCCFMHCTAQIL